MRFSGATALFFGGSALALSPNACLKKFGPEIAAVSRCERPGQLPDCFLSLRGEEISDVAACYQDAGCSSSNAESEAAAAIQKCMEIERVAVVRYGGQQRDALLPEKTPQVNAVEAIILRAAVTPVLQGRDEKLQCLITETVQTTTCPVSTNGVRLTTLPCVPTQIAKSRCAPGLMCSLDPSGNNVCMKLHNTLDIGGIIIAIIFGVAIVIGVSALTFMCCKDRRDQKKLEARAEATALARAETKRARAADARAPLMRQNGGGPDPFHDRNHS